MQKKRANGSKQVNLWALLYLFLFFSPLLIFERTELASPRTSWEFWACSHFLSSPRKVMVNILVLLLLCFREAREDEEPFPRMGWRDGATDGRPPRKAWLGAGSGLYRAPAYLHVETSSTANLRNARVHTVCKKKHPYLFIAHLRILLLITHRVLILLVLSLSLLKQTDN